MEFESEGGYVYRGIILGFVAAAAICWGAPCQGADVPSTQPGGAARTGDFDLNFAQRSPLSSRQELASRFNFKLADMGDDYDLTKCVFKTYVPANYDPSVPVGIFVYLGYKGSVATPPLWHPVLDRHHLIFISPAWHSGKLYPPAIPLWQATGLAIDAVDNLKKQYSIDGKRVYLMNWNEGSMQQAFATSDIFTGYVVAFDQEWWQRIWISNTQYYDPTFSLGSAHLYALAKPHPFVFLDDKSDENGTQFGYQLKAMAREDFEHVTHLQSSLMGQLHYPMLTTDWFEQALGYLDKNSNSAGSAAAPAPVAAAASDSAATGPSAATAPSAGPSRAQSLLSVAKLLIANGQTDLARAKLQEIIRGYPTDPAVGEAKQLLDQIGAQ
jgi:hypothetical protein